MDFSITVVVFDGVLKHKFGMQTGTKHPNRTTNQMIIYHNECYVPEMSIIPGYI